LYEDKFRQEETVPDRFKVFYIESGAGVCDIDGRTYRWIAPCLICLNETQVFTSGEIAGPLWALYFHPGAINPKLDMENIRDLSDDVIPESVENRLLVRVFIWQELQFLFNHLSPETALRVRSLMEHVREQLDIQATTWWPCLFKSYLAELLFLIARLRDTEAEKNGDGISGFPALHVSPEFSPVLDFIMRNYYSKLSLNDLAREFGTNRTSLNERFKSETGMTAIAYLIDLRLRIASALLNNTYLPVAEIAERVGIGDVSYFERIFRQKYHQSPSAYRLTAKG
jgi:AraC family L-rhamnose operon regulatory protein RhaS